MGDILVDTESTKDLAQKNVSFESYDNECNEYMCSDLKDYCNLPAAIQTGIVDRLNGDFISVNHSNNIQVGTRIGKVVVDTLTVVSPSKKKSNPNRRKLLILGVLSSLGLAAVIGIVYYVSSNESEELEWFVKRRAWGAKDAKQPCQKSDEKQVVEVVLFQTKTEFCYNFDECSQIVRNIQDTDLTDIFATDIKYNFLIGGDGKVYEGLDWLCKGEHVFLPFSAVHIGVIGDYSKYGHNNRLSESQIKVLHDLFRYGKEKQKLYEHFGITPACCYKNASDPGDNVLSEIVHWPEFVRACLHTSNCDYSSVSDMETLLNNVTSTVLGVT